MILIVYSIAPSSSLLEEVQGVLLMHCAENIRTSSSESTEPDNLYQSSIKNLNLTASMSLGKISLENTSVLENLAQTDQLRRGTFLSMPEFPSHKISLITKPTPQVRSFH
ncbi:unnamed protein product [Lepeophtheirus salmonis]|uniref:(salmon louse) hypothetical protein n=1 Tax=Lepeophtheirus salmonis TaxID=72036 RepID=A0A7R8CZK4_LEPSM|nr:unnamed protein product [Lepeophtheirus salmonis]CAF2950891.1 unnamed protein product [Lepeophtheirus salmonis]